MAGGTKDGGNGRRKSMNLFGRSALSSLTPINTDTQSDKTEEGPEKKKDKKKLSKRSSIFGLSSLSTSDLQAEVRSPVERSSSPKARPRTLQKGRPTSIFGSLGRKSGSYADEELDNLASTPESPLEPGESPPLEQGRTMGRAVTHHGEVQTQSGLFRKKKEYLVLTDSHLIRFKGQSRAYDAFPSIPPAQGRGNTSRHASTASIGSLQDAQSTHTHDSSTKETRIPLNQIVTAYKLEDGRPFFTTEVVFLDEEYHGAGSIQLMLQRPEDADLWHTSIRGAAQKAKLLMTEPYPERVVNYLISALELAQDYYPDHFQIFRVVRRPPLAKGNKSTADDLQKLNASVFYLVIGLNKLHLIPLPDFADPSTRLTNSKVPRESYGLVTLTSMNVQHSDDRFELSFRAPFTEEKTLILAGASNPDIAIFIYKALSYLKPQWTHRTYDINGPKGFLEKVELYPIDPDEEYGGFDRTLTAYCMAYNCNAFNIVYGVDWSVEDAPEWRLYPPAGGLHYTANELLAIMRSLRFNEHFCSISFQNINLQSLCGIYDTRGKDHVALRTRSGIPIRDYYNISTDGSLLYQEIQALALSSRRLRRFDFTNTLPQQRPKDTFDADEESPGRNKDPGCEIVSALFPMCHAELTSVDWVILNGVELGEADLELLGPAMKNRRARFRGFEISRCGLDDRSLNILLSLVHKQCNSIECLNVSDNPGRLNIENFHDSMARYTKIRKLDLSRTPRSLGDAPLLTEEILLSWHLEELYLNGISFNKATLECISGYLMSNASENLHTLQMEQCNMTGSDLALLMMSMTRKPGEGRELTLSVSNNRLENDINEIVKAIQENHTPSHLIMRMIEFTKEDHFKRLLEALRTNKTIKMLDISKASLPYDANQETCEALNRLFAENTTLEELDISGEQSHLEVTRFGIGLNSALTGLTENHTLKTLRIEYQNLGLEGANTLSSVLEKNQGLEEIYCDHNNISLQGFTIIVNALASNHYIQFIEEMRHDEQHFIAEMTGNYNEQRKAVSNPSHVRRTLTNLGVGKNSKQDIQWPDTVGVIRELERSWQLQVDRLNIFLERNRRMAQGGSQSGDGVVLEDAMRPTTALSQKGMLEHILSNTTPKVELDDPVDDHFKHLALESVDGPFGEENDQFQDQTPTKARNHDNNLPQIHRAKMMFEIGDDGDPLFEMEK